MLQDDPLRYKDALIYELHVRAFHDSDGDGIGDFKGLTQKLDYLQDLSIPVGAHWPEMYPLPRVASVESIPSLRRRKAGR